MLQITGTVLSVKTERVDPPNSESFDSTTIRLMAGEGADASIEYVNVARRFDLSTLPAEGDTVTLNVYAMGYVSKTTNRAGVRLYAASVAQTGARVAAAV